MNSTIILDKEDLEKKMENIKREEEETKSKIKITSITLEKTLYQLLEQLRKLEEFLLD